MPDRAPATTFDPRLKLLAQSLIELRTGLDVQVYVDTVATILDHVGVSGKKTLLFLASKDKEKALLRYLADNYRAQEDQSLLMPTGRRAIEMLGADGEALLLPYVNAIFRDSAKQDVWQSAGAACAYFGIGIDDEVVNPHLKALNDSYKFARSAAASALGKLGRADDQVVNALIKTLNDIDEIVRSDAASALGQLGRADDRLISALVSLLSDDHSYIRSSAATSLVQLQLSNKNHLKNLSRFLPEETVRQRAIFTLCSVLEGVPIRWFSAKFRTLKLRYAFIPKDRMARYILESILHDSLQTIFDTPGCMLSIVARLMDETDPDRVYFALPFASIRQITVRIALELIKELSNPDTTEQVKRVLFSVLTRVELIDEKGRTMV